MNNDKRCNKFEEYYYKYLNYNEEDNIILSENRERTTNFFYYPVIVAMYNNKTIYSISPKYYLELKTIIQNENPRNKEDIKNVLNKYFKSKKREINIQEMFRMTKKEKIDVDTSYVINIKEENKEEYFNSFDYHQEKTYKENKWKQIKRYKYLNGIVEDGKIVSLGFIPNIDYNGANIVIQTKEK